MASRTGPRSLQPSPRCRKGNADPPWTARASRKVQRQGRASAERQGLRPKEPGPPAPGIVSIPRYLLLNSSLSSFLAELFPAARLLEWISILRWRSTISAVEASRLFAEICLELGAAPSRIRPCPLG